MIVWFTRKNKKTISVLWKLSLAITKILSKSSHAKSTCHLTLRESFHVKRAQQSSYPFGQLRDSLASILESRILFSNSAVWESRPFADKDSRFSCVHSEADFQLFRAWEEGREGKCECRPPRHKTSCSHTIEKKIVCNGRGSPMRMEIHDHRRASLGPMNSKHRSSAARVDNIHLPPVLCWLEDRSGNLKALCEEFVVAWADEHRQRGRGSWKNWYPGK